MPRLTMEAVGLSWIKFGSGRYAKVCGGDEGLKQVEV